MRLKRKSMVVGFIVVAGLVLSSFNSVFAQCSQGYIHCTSYPAWCCSSEQYCVDPTPPYCEPVSGTSSTTSSALPSTSTTSSSNSTSSSTSSSTVTTTVPSTSSSSSSPTTAPNSSTTAPPTTTTSCPPCYDGWQCCGGICCGPPSETVCDYQRLICIPADKCCASTSIFGEDSEEVELLRKYRDEVLNETPEGRTIIRLYYALSPLVVRLLEEDALLNDYVSSMAHLWIPPLVKAMEEDEEFRERVMEMISVILPLLEYQAE